MLKTADGCYLDYLKGLVREFVRRLSPAVRREIRDWPLTGPNGVRRLLGEASLEFFAKAYFPNYFTYETPQFHKEAYAELDRILSGPPRGARLVRVWPRGNAKSTIYNFFAPCNAVLYGKRQFLVQFSESETQAQGFLADIKSAFENNNYILEDFGDVQGPVWRADLISVRTTRGTLSWIAAAGAESSVRGLRKAEFRPDMITLDDIEGDESVQTPERVNKRWMWFQRAVMNLGTENTDVIVVGTLMAYDCVLDRLVKHPGWDSKVYSAVIRWSDSPLWDEWRKIYTDLSLPKEERKRRADAFFEEHREEMLEGTEVLWPEARPYKVLMEIYTDIGEIAFAAEHQNKPINTEECLFKPEWLVYYDEDELEKVYFTDFYGALDPSLGKTRLSDYTALIVLGRAESGILYVLEAVIERLTPDRIVDLLLDVCREYEFTRFGIETNQYQDLLRLMIVERSAREGVYVPIVPLQHNKDKVLRVQALVPYIRNGYVRFNKEHRLLIEQLLGFPKLRHDDGPDALEMAVRMAGMGASFGPVLGGTVPDDEEDVEDFCPRHFYS
ncbi:MAG: phage terminase large subunit [Elusimicrobiales bacterium]